MLISGSIQRPGHVWDNCSGMLSEDIFYVSHSHPNYSGPSSPFTLALYSFVYLFFTLLRTFLGLHVHPSLKEEEALRKIDALLILQGKSLAAFPGIPLPPEHAHLNVCNPLIQQEMSYDKAMLQELSSKLNDALTVEQKGIFDCVIHSTDSPIGAFFFVHGFRGTDKTFLWNALTSALRANGKIVINVASSGIAATVLPSGRTAHSRFTIPIHVHEDSVCNIKQRSHLAELLINTTLIIWDEAPMVRRYCIEAFDRSLRDIIHSDHIFGGKCVVMGGDFRQILPVIPKGTRATIVDACISSSVLWHHCKVFHLTKSICAYQKMDQNVVIDKLKGLANGYLTWVMADLVKEVTVSMKLRCQKNF